MQQKAFLKQYGRYLFLMACLIPVWLASCAGGGGEPESTAEPTADPSIPFPTPTWSDLGLTGRLLYLIYNDQGEAQLVQLDLVTGRQSVLYQPPSGAWLIGFDASEDGQQLALAYLPPPGEGREAAGYNSLYVMPTLGSRRPEHLAGDGESEAFFAPAWSPDGRYIYGAVYNRLEGDADIPFQYVLERVAYPGGQRTLLLENGIWPSPSPDGSRLAYLSFDPTSEDNELFLAAADGSGATPVLPAGSFPAVDAHFFSPDSSMIYFSAINEEAPAGLSWLDRLLGVRVAEAHDVPSDWWRMSLDGGQPERLTELGATNLYADFSPDGQFIAFLGSTGVYVMRPDGRELTRLLDPGPFGNLSWVP